MTLTTLMITAAGSYPEILEYFDVRSGKAVQRKNSGDSLAQFVALELSDTFDPEASDEQQIASAACAMTRAADQLQAVASILSDTLRVRKAAA